MWAQAWLHEASKQSVQRNPNSMVLATVADNGQPSARVLLCKSFIVEPGYLVFFTNYRSRKVKELETNPNVAVTFHWDTLGRQIRLEGPAVLSPSEESDAYFETRDLGSQLGAWGSDQSSPLRSPHLLKQQLRERAARFGVDTTQDLSNYNHRQMPVIPRPPHWGGVRVWPARIELWIEGTDRIHDRAAWTRTLSAKGDYDFEAGDWAGGRLQP